MYISHRFCSIQQYYSYTYNINICAHKKQYTIYSTSFIQDAWKDINTYTEVYLLPSYCTYILYIQSYIRDSFDVKPNLAASYTTQLCANTSRKQLLSRALMLLYPRLCGGGNRMHPGTAEGRWGRSCDRCGRQAGTSEALWLADAVVVSVTVNCLRSALVLCLSLHLLPRDRQTSGSDYSDRKSVV